MGRTSSTTLLTLPSELIEAILICSRSPRTVASIAQICRKLRALVYASPDSHLWRELFLTTWDDPRPALEHRALIDPRVYPATWDWGAEYRRRVRADKWLKAWRRDILPADVDPHKDPGWYAESMSSLVAVLDTLMTLRPFPATPPIALTVMTPAASTHPTEQTESGAERRQRMTSAPPLPPLLIVLASGLSVVTPSRSGVRLARTVYGPHASRAQQDDGSETGQTPIPTPSLPPHLVRALLASHTIGVRGVPPYAPHLWDVAFWGRDPLGDVFHRIICITGFVPIAPPVSPSTFVFVPGSVSERIQSTCLGTNNGREVENKVATQEDGEDHVKKGYLISDGKRVGSIPEPFPTPSEQHTDARILARRRVYDMRYPRGDRLWGPFHPVTKESLTGSDSPGEFKTQKNETHVAVEGSASRRRGIRHLNTLAWAMGIDVELDDVDSTSDDNSSDEDWQDPAETNRGASSSSEARHEQVAGAQGVEVEEVDSDLEEPSFLSLIFAPRHADGEPTNNASSSRRRTRRSRDLRSKSADLHDIKPEHLKADYAYLASARIVVEANLREFYGGQTNNDDDHELASPGTRTGGVGMFWEDEDELLRARPGSLEQAFPHASSSNTTTQERKLVSDPTTFEFVDILARFRNLEVARLGGSCGYWSGWITRQRSENASATTSSGNLGLRKPRIITRRDELEKQTEDVSNTLDKGKGKEKCIEPAEPKLGDWEIGLEGGGCEGWDWAGVAGIWKRCVCWMDYRELLFFNLDPTKFMTLNTQEACRMIPMELRITGYTRARLMPVFDPKHDPHSYSDCSSHKNVRYFRPPPIIHFSGLSVGFDRDSDEGRPLSGCVHLIGGGEVRWQLDTYTKGSNPQGSSSTPEWSSEGVQVGAIGSAVGVLGMWTGAGHERADPLGPFWMWKVA